MSSKTITMVLAEALEDLSAQNFERFCHQLLDRRDEPRVRRSRVEGKSRLEIVNVLVSTFTESGARQVAQEILTEIDCNEEAREFGYCCLSSGSANGAASCLFQRTDRLI
ncbi:uncharacterized protein V6R79_025539 [Siganus canaliculatus]